MLTHPAGATPAASRSPLPDEGMAVGHHAFTPAPAPEVLTPAQAAELLQVTEAELLALAEAGELPGRRIGGALALLAPRADRLARAAASRDGATRHDAVSGDSRTLRTSCVPPLVVLDCRDRA